MRSQVERCECSRDTVSLKRDEEHVRLLLRVSSMPLISTLQNMAHQANAEINYLVQRSKYNLYEEMQSEFPRLLSQPSVGDSIEELFQKLRNQLFVSTDLSPLRIEKEIQKAIQSFFMQLLAPTFICATTTTTESVTQSYANCLRNNAPSWKIFYGSEQNELIAKLQRAILNYRIIEKTIDKLHRSVVEMETMNTSCIAGFTAAVYCDLDCSDLKRTSLPIRYCNDACINAVYNCLGDSVQHWNSFVTILRKLSVDFDYGFSQLEKEIINSVSYAFQIQAPSIARVVLKKCIALLSNQSTSAPLTVTDHYFSHPPAIEMKLISTIRKFTSYIGWWEKFAANLCADASRSSVCWNGTILISRL
ncbi:unnamed protein product [Anisakis simplex]|uniref:Uncharacterized protein n=1 Tax=Anisakis simplex TaxID=6269 RepID=A0A0M3K0M9_ANISI|nr:unnamed protein product [Anisakis simplex]